MSLTLKDIARMAGVAESTVSRAINNKAGVGDKTKAKIMKIVEEYSFQPNQLAQGLAKQKTHMLALILSDLATPGYNAIIKSIEAIANQKGYHIIICNTDNNVNKKKTYLELVSNNRVDGAIIVGGDLADRNVLNLALNKKDSIVLVNCLAEELLIPTVLIDSARGAYLATTHLLEQGLERISIIMGDANNYLESEKLSGYNQALNDFGIPLNRDFILETDISREGGFNAFLKSLEGIEIPEAFFVTSDILAIGLIDAIKTGGFFIPDDFAIIGYGESIITSIINPALTVVAEPLQELGNFAAEYLIQLLEDKEPEERIKVLEPVLKLRETSIPQIK